MTESRDSSLGVICTVLGVAMVAWAIYMLSVGDAGPNRLGGRLLAFGLPAIAFGIYHLQRPSRRASRRRRAAGE